MPNSSFVRSKFILPVFIVLYFWIVGGVFSALAQLRPDEQLKELFEAVQLEPVFPDSKTFPDCIALYPPEQILQQYRNNKNKPDFDLELFVFQNFKLPPEAGINFASDTSKAVSEHINLLWPVLTREPRSENSSLISLPHRYVVPGGRFREIYYWDSYFTMLGLQVSNRTDLIQDMVDNFTYLINTVGHIPKGNRSYYVSRSQPPFYVMMLEILAEEKGPEILQKYAPALQKEYTFWMDGAASLHANIATHRRVVRMPDGSILNRYWDDQPTPRAEAYKEDVLLAVESGRNPEEVYRHVKAAAESGWDFSTRWFADGKTLQTIHTTDIIPVDLNSLLYHVELKLAQMAQLEGNHKQQQEFLNKAARRKKAILKYCWNNEVKFFMDYDYINRKTTNIFSLAAVYPLYFGIAKKYQATAVARRIEADFIKPGGLITTLQHSSQQWDAPNGWAPLQWLSVQGLNRYQHKKLANQIAQNWINLNKVVYKSTGKLMEKYNVENTNLKAGGGEYPLQDGFGWTNGVLLKLLSISKQP